MDARSSQKFGGDAGRRHPTRSAESRTVHVLGIDPGLANTGFGLVARRGGRLVALDGGVIETRAGVALEQRLARLFADVEELLARHRPEAVALEDLYFG